MTQKEQIINLLKTGRSITPMSALRNYGCFRLAAVIHKLKKQGMDIETTIINEGDKTYAQYNLIQKGELL
tara:strand:+ start:325 stop:534 length:210 start_codon:yes stop_codon:yes gene_type:complete